jgi:hypothetical protein
VYYLERLHNFMNQLKPGAACKKAHFEHERREIIENNLKERREKIEANKETVQIYVLSAGEQPTATSRGPPKGAWGPPNPPL